MRDNGGTRRTWRQVLREAVLGARTDTKADGLANLVEPGREKAYEWFGNVHPRHQTQLQLLYGESQRAFESQTRQSMRVTIQCVLSNVLRDPRLMGEEPNRYLGEYLNKEISGLRARVDQDCALAVSRGINVGLTLGALISMVLLIVPLLAGGGGLLGLVGIEMGCTDRWSLMGAFVCGGVGAFGAVLSVLVRLRNTGGELSRRRTNGDRGTVAPGQMARAMRHEGVYRIFVGWILALAVYFLLSAGFIKLFDMPATTVEICAGNTAGAGTAFWGFWCGVGFLAGFNERWAFGLLDRSNRTERHAASSSQGSAAQASATESNST
ncbi:MULTISPECIES: hypothetical protein [unclassified Streptomyces]|uniref:hypothetical protein n=1 Tax=unclassified Streptomyces TaxID=2593676 RepID=UPI0036549EE1